VFHHIAGSDALALEKISIEQLSRLGEVSKRKLDIQRSGGAQGTSGQASMGTCIQEILHKFDKWASLSSSLRDSLYIKV